MNNKLVFVTVLAFALVPMITGGATGAEAVVGSTCLVPIVHTNFSFPPEGGKIVRIGDHMYFVQDYRPECADAGASGQLIKGSLPNTVSGTTNEQPTVNSNQSTFSCKNSVY